MFPVKRPDEVWKLSSGLCTVYILVTCVYSGSDKGRSFSPGGVDIDMWDWIREPDQWNRDCDELLDRWPSFSSSLNVSLTQLI